MNNAEIAHQLVECLSLDSPPVALQFVKEVPKDMLQFSGTVPAGCAFWRKAEQGIFYASASDHANCPVGVHTMGLPMSSETAAALGRLVQQMSELNYLNPAEVANIPTVSGEKCGIVYGSLAAMETQPDAILIWVTPYQAMLLSEVTGSMTWSQHSGVPTFGRPGCAAIPAALNQGMASLSLGCMGMRTFTEISQHRMLAVLPQQLMPTLIDGLQRATSANQRMYQLYDQKRVATSGS